MSGPDKGGQHHRNIHAGIFNYSPLLLAQGRYNENINFLDSICDITLCDQYCEDFLFWTHFMIGHYEEAEKYFNHGLTKASLLVADSLSLAYIYGKTDRELKAKTILESCRVSLDEIKPENMDWEYYICLSMYHAMINDKEKFLRYLSKSIDCGLKAGWHDVIPVFPVFQPYWNDPDFQSLVRQAQEDKAAKRKQVQEMIDRGAIDL